MFIFPAQLTTCRIGNLTRLMHTLAICVTIHTYIVQDYTSCHNRLSMETTGLPNPSRETKFPGANADREIFIFLVQLTTYRIGNLTRLIHTPGICDDHTYSKSPLGFHFIRRHVE